MGLDLSRDHNVQGEFIKTSSNPKRPLNEAMVQRCPKLEEIGFFGTPQCGQH